MLMQTAKLAHRMMATTNALTTMMDSGPLTVTSASPVDFDGMSWSRPDGQTTLPGRDDLARPVVKPTTHRDPANAHS
jgi:hypothetical protein